jgi:motility/secretion related protein SprA
MWREIRRILAQVAVTFGSTLQANLAIPRSVARLAFALVLALPLGAAPLSAQQPAALDTVHVLPLDSAGYITRTQELLFRRSLPKLVLPPVAWWELLPGQSHVPAVMAAFDSAIKQNAAEHRVAVREDHLLRQVDASYLAAADSTPAAARGLFGFSSKNVEVTFEGTLQFQISTTRQRNLACTPAQVQDVASGCSGGFKSPTIDNTVLLSSRGVFAQRFHINIDFDSKRDYAAGQVVSVNYQGLEDEKLKRVDVGTVQWTPPPSRFFTASIPSNNFGISADAEFGPLEVRGIVAAQKGSVVANKTYVIGNGVVAPQDVSQRDVDYEARRLFWVVNPTTIPSYPAVDILNAGSIVIPVDSQPAQVQIYRYVSANQTSGANANYDGVTASARNGAGEVVGALRWRLLKRNIDYWLDPSGLWFTLTSAISPSDYLAVSYTTKSGGTVGTMPIVDDSTKHDQLRLIYLPNRTPASPLFNYEMRQAYRVAGSSLVRSSLRAQLLVAGSERPDSATGTFLSLLGMAQQSDQASLDVDNRLFPRVVRDPGAPQLIKDAMLIFPNARPFADPRLSTRERNDSMYVTPEYLLFTQGQSKFQVHLMFDAQGGSDRSSITLDGLQITEGSEHIAVGGRPLIRDVDYSIDYTTGRVSFLNPNDLFGNGAATVTASFEQRGLFAVAPTTIAGISTTWNFGIGKSLSLSALYQSEATPYTRPQVGYEARASLLAGLTGDFNFNAPWLTSIVNHLVTKRSTALSSFRVTGELAISRPDPNRSGDAYLEEFEDDHSIHLPASQNRWVPGSMPQSAAGLLDVMPRGFDSTEKVQMIWQNLVPNGHDSVTQFSPHDIDSTIALTQSSTPTIEPVLWTALHADTAGGIVDFNYRSHWSQPALLGPHARWASYTTALSPTGLDLTNNDYFEFALYQNRDTLVKATKTRIVIDLGKVSEDALAIAPTNFLVLGPADLVNYPQFSVGDTVYTGRQYVGVGVLNTEKTFFGTWSATTDDVGILGDRPDSLIGPNHLTLHRPALCTDQLSASVLLYRWGDLGARCSNANGNPDTEDLDGDNVLDAQGPNDDVFRYVVNLADSEAKYLVRTTRVYATKGDTNSNYATWSLYRVPIRQANDTIGNPDLHLIKQMRLTFVAPPANDGQERIVFLALALMRFSGASWVGRSASPIASLSGPTAEPHGTVQVGTVSTQDGYVDTLHVDHGYTSPPGIGDAAATTAVSSAQFSQQINEKALSIAATDLHAGERAEGYIRLIDGSKNLLNYNELRVWMRGGDRLNSGPAAGWDDGRLRAYVKLGSDAYNFYMFSAPAHTATWDPEMLVDLRIWQDLRLQIENARLRSPTDSGRGYRACGFRGDSTAWIACRDDGSGSYFVQVRDPQTNPPNLAAVQELAAGIYYPPGAGAPISSTELWVDDIRLGLPVSNIGVVGALAAHAQVADVATLDLSGVYQDGNFHGLTDAPTYQNIASLAAVGAVRLERFLPAAWGLVIPASVTSNWGWTDPQLISGTDVQANGITGLRRPRNDATQWQFSIRHPNRQNEHGLSRLVLSPFSFTASGSAATSIAALSEVSSTNWSTGLAYVLGNRRRAYPFHLTGLVSGLPRWLRESSAGRGIANAAFAPVPTLVQFTSTLTHSMGDIQAYQLPIQVLADTILKPVTTEQFLWRNTAAVTWEPLTMLTVISNWSSTRDLREYADSTSLGRVAGASRESLFGADVGVESERNVVNVVTLAPHLVSWLGTSATVAANFVLSRSLTSRNPVRIDGDTAGAYILPQTLNNSRVITYRVTVNPYLLSQRLLGDSSHVSRALIQVQPILFTRTHTLESTFDLARFDPGLNYQLALGGFSSFLARNGQTAIGAAEATATTAAATVDLPMGISAQLSYTSTESDRYQHQTGSNFLKSTGTSTAWPSGRVSWTQTFRGGPIAQLAGSAGLERDLQASSDGTGTDATSETRRWTPDLFIRLRNAVGVRINGQFDYSTSQYGGNVTETASKNLSGNISWTLRMPRFLSASRRSLSSNVSISQNTSSSCIQSTADAACVSYFDLSRLDVHTGFTAFMSRGIRAGLDFGYSHNAVQSLHQISSTITLSALFSVPLSSLGM